MCEYHLCAGELGTHSDMVSKTLLLCFCSIESVCVCVCLCTVAQLLCSVFLESLCRSGGARAIPQPHRSPVKIVSWKLLCHWGTGQRREFSGYIFFSASVLTCTFNTNLYARTYTINLHHSCTTCRVSWMDRRGEDEGGAEKGPHGEDNKDGNKSKKA